MHRKSRSSSRDHVHHRQSSRSRSRANSLSSDSILSRESVSDFKLKLSSMENELDATLRSLTGSDVNSTSESGGGAGPRCVLHAFDLADLEEPADPADGRSFRGCVHLPWAQDRVFQATPRSTGSKP